MILWFFKVPKLTFEPCLMDSIEEQVNLVFELRYKRADDYSLSRNLKVVVVCVCIVCTYTLCVGSQKRMDFFRGGETNSSSFILYTQIQKSKSIYVSELLRDERRPPQWCACTVTTAFKNSNMNIYLCLGLIQKQSRSECKFERDKCWVWYEKEPWYILNWSSMRVLNICCKKSLHNTFSKLK